LALGRETAVTAVAAGWFGAALDIVRETRTGVTDVGSAAAGALARGDTDARGRALTRAGAIVDGTFNQGIGVGDAEPKEGGSGNDDGGTHISLMIECGVVGRGFLL